MPACCLLRPAPAAAATPDPATLAQIDKIFGRLAPVRPRPRARLWRRCRRQAGAQSSGLGVQDPGSNRAVTADSLFRIASMSKAFTALAILKLRDEGKLSLDAPAENYVPEMKGWRYPTTDSPRITVRNLLTHTAGFVEDNPWGDRQQVMPEAEFTAMLSARRADFSRAPGLGNGIFQLRLRHARTDRHQRLRHGLPGLYPPRDHAAAGHGLERLSTSSPRRSRAERSAIAGKTTSWVREPDMADGTFGAMGGVETSASDYAKWVAFLLSAWPARDGPETGPVRRSTVREIVTGANFPEASNRSAAIGGAPCRHGRNLRHGLARDRGLRPRPRRHPHRRLSRLRLGRVAAARQGRRHFRFLQPHLRRPVAARLPGGNGAEQGRRVARAADRGHSRPCGSLCGGPLGLGARATSPPRRSPTTC